MNTGPTCESCTNIVINPNKTKSVSSKSRSTKSTKQNQLKLQAIDDMQRKKEELFRKCREDEEKRLEKCRQDEEKRLEKCRQDEEKRLEKWHEKEEQNLLKCLEMKLRLIQDDDSEDDQCVDVDDTEVNNEEIAEWVNHGLTARGHSMPSQATHNHKSTTPTNKSATRGQFSEEQLNHNTVISNHSENANKQIQSTFHDSQVNSVGQNQIEQNSCLNTNDERSIPLMTSNANQRGSIDRNNQMTIPVSHDYHASQFQPIDYPMLNTDFRNRSSQHPSMVVHQRDNIHQPFQQDAVYRNQQRVSYRMQPIENTVAPSFKNIQVAPVDIHGSHGFTSSVPYNDIQFGAAASSSHQNVHPSQSTSCDEIKLNNANVLHEILGEIQNHYSNSMPPGLTSAQRAARKTVNKDLPKFSGKPDEWQYFISSYEQTTATCGLTNDENLTRLKSCLQGEALEMVRNRLQLPKDVPGAIETLRLLYGTPEIIINSVLKKLRKEPPPKHDNRESLIKFAVSVQDLCVTMVNSNLPEYLNNPMLLQELVAKLPENIKYDWAKYRASQQGPVTIQTFEPWIMNITKALCSVSIEMGWTDPNKWKQQPRGAQISNKSKGFVHAHSGAESTNTTKCVVCGESCVNVSACNSFKALSYNNKWSAVKKHQLCRCCLRKHKQPCKTSKVCGQNGCKFRHHTLLHKVEANSDVPDPSTSGQQTVTSQILTHRSVIPTTILFRVVPVILHGPNKTIKTYAFLDDGSSLTLVESGISEELGLKGELQPLCLKWTANTHRMENDSKKVSLSISGTLNPDRKFNINNAHTVESLNLPFQSLTIEQLQQSCPHLRDIPIEPYDQVSPRVLIGIDNLNLTAPLSCREGKIDQPVAIKSRLGWSVCGPCEFPNISNTSVQHSFHMCECNHDETLERMMKDYFSLESMGPPKSAKLLESSEETRAREILESTTIRRGDHFESGLLWRMDSVTLPDSRLMAERRLQCLNNKMAKDPDLAAVLQKQIDDHVVKGYVRKLSDEEIAQTVPHTWYLPIFPVFNPNKPGKVRLVWDAAAKVDGKSLNSVLLKGPDQLVSLTSVLSKFRERKIAICADIQEMFLQIQIRREDQDAQRFLWRNVGEAQTSVYVMQVMTFGTTSSPCTAQFVKNKNAIEFADQHPRAVQSILENHYVDDLLDSVDTVDEAIQLAKDVKMIHKSGGFHIRNWISNTTDVVHALGESIVEKSKNLNIINTELGTDKVLGMLWCTTTDCFNFKLTRNRGNDQILSGLQRPTKRQILRVVMMVFDPLGLLAQFMVYAKVLLQQIWLAKLDWDDPLPDDLFEKWLHWLKYLPQIEDIRIPRCYLQNLTFNNNNNIELHIFVDASRDAFAATAYFRVEGDGVECSLICAKTRVAPLKLLSIPRLELEGAVLGVRMANNIIESHTIKPSTRYFWTDSKTVLSWIRSDHRKYRQFVAFRVSEILEQTDIKEWRYVPSALNVADDGTKWPKNPIFESDGRWYRGPNFLYQGSTDWPRDCIVEITTEEELRVQHHHSATINQTLVRYEDFSTWKSLRRRWMYILRFTHNLKAKRRGEALRTKCIHRGLPCFEHVEYQEAEYEIYRQTQREGYREEINILNKNQNNSPGPIKHVMKSSAIYSSNPYVDKNGLLRAHGRIDRAADVGELVKRPILLPRNHHVTNLIIQFYHSKYHHQNNETITNEIRQVFSIPKLRVEVKKSVKSCQWCKIRTAQPESPMMSELPQARMQSFTRPFSFIGIDYFGPMLVKVGRRTEKRWGVLITCLTIRAIHLEVAHSLSTDSCILCLRNFMSRRGTPIEIYSDNGTNFIGANRELQEAVKKIDQMELMREFSSPHTKWLFNPPARCSPYGG